MQASKGDVFNEEALMSRAVEQGVQEFIREASPLFADMDEFKDSLLNAEEVLEGAGHKCQRCETAYLDFCTFVSSFRQRVCASSSPTVSLVTVLCLLVARACTTSIVATLNCLAQETIHQELQGSFCFGRAQSANFSSSWKYFCRVRTK